LSPTFNRKQDVDINLTLFVLLKYKKENSILEIHFDSEKIKKLVFKLSFYPA